MTPQEKAKDKRLRKNYDWTLEMYYELGELQEWKCAGCGKQAKNKQLNVDHHHFRIFVAPNNPSGWVASTNTNNYDFYGWGKTKAEAIRNCKKIALPYSVRVLLCPGRQWGCNRRLGRVDDIKWLKSMVVYLENPPAKKILNAIKN